MKIDSQITFYYTQKYDETIKFYKNILGLKAVLDQGNCTVFEVTENAYLGFCHSATPVQTADAIFTFVTSEVDEWYESLVAKGVKFTKAPEVNEKFQIYHTFMIDPNGYKLEIQRFLDGDWNKEK